MNFRSVIHWFSLDHRAVITLSIIFIVSLYTVDPSLHIAHSLYSAMWSNMWAPSVWTLTGLLAADVRSARRHKQLKAHHTAKADDLATQIEGLADRLVELTGGSTNDI